MLDRYTVLSALTRPKGGGSVRTCYAVIFGEVELVWLFDTLHEASDARITFALFGHALPDQHGLN